MTTAHRLASLCIVLGAATTVRCVGERHVSLLELEPSGADSSSANSGMDAGNPSQGDAAAGGGIQLLGDGGLEAMRATACVTWTAEHEPEPAVLAFVVDVSGSMNLLDPSGDGISTKWQVAQPALREAVAALPPALGVGLIPYPNMASVANAEPLDSSACVNVNAVISPLTLGPVGSNARRVVDASIEGTVPSDQAGTPTHDGYLIALRELARTSLPGRQYVMLMTDGQPTFSKNCVGTGLTNQPVSPEPIIQEIAAARVAGIGTFVIGAPGSEQTATLGEDARPWLSRAAEAGGSPLPGCSHWGPNFCHFDMVAQPDFGAALRAALSEIAGSVVDCSFELPTPPPGEVLDPGRVNVVFSSQTGEHFAISRSDEVPCDQGWQYSSDGSRIVLCDGTCQLVQSDIGGRLELLFGCDTFEVVH